MPNRELRSRKTNLVVRQEVLHASGRPQLHELRAQLDAKDQVGRTPMTFAEGIFLAVRPPVAKPTAISLLKQLMTNAPATPASQP